MLHEPLDPGRVRQLVDQVVPFERAPTRETGLSLAGRAAWRLWVGLASPVTAGERVAFVAA